MSFEVMEIMGLEDLDMSRIFDSFEEEEGLWDEEN